MTRLLALSLTVALALTACGGEGETTTVEVGASTAAADEEAIEELVTAYGLTDDPAVGCKLFSLDYLAELGGSKACMSEKWYVEQVQVEQVTLDGDTASVIVVRKAAPRRSTIPVVREGEPSDAYDGWRVAGERVPISDADGAAQPPAATEDSTTPEAESPPQTPEEKAVAYRVCIEGRGAKDVKQDDFPSVNFSGGGSRVNAMFGASEEDAEQGLATLMKRKPFFAERIGTVVLYTVGDPLADDLEIGLGCVKELG